MSIIYFLIGCSMLLALIFLRAFFWAQENGQNDDLHTPSMRILLDDEDDYNPNTSATHTVENDEEISEKNDQGHFPD